MRISRPTLVGRAGFALVLLVATGLAAPAVQAKEPPWPPDARFAKWDRNGGVPPDALQFRLIDFARALEGRQWNAAIAFFDPQHLGDQVSLYAADLFKKKAGDLTPGQRRTVLLLYLYDTLDVRPAPGAPKRSGTARVRLLEGIAQVMYLGMNGSDANIGNIQFSLHGAGGRVIARGVIQVQRLNLKFTGAVG